MSQCDLEAVLARLKSHYDEINRTKFDGLLPSDYRIEFNPLLRRLTGRITYGWRLIEISLYHFRTYGYADAVQTLEHEMLHLYLHTLGKPSGHNRWFRQFAEALGIRVFHANAYPKNRSSRSRYVYECPSCRRMVFRKRPRAHAMACGICCREHANGVWDGRFCLELVEKVIFA